MGLTYVTVKVRDLMKTGTAYESKFLVDTGAIHSLAAAEHLTGAGIIPEGKAIHELADGSSVEYEHGFARLSFLGEETVSAVVFGPAGSAPILGVTALESAGFVVDPVSNTLKRLHAMPLK